MDPRPITPVSVTVASMLSILASVGVLIVSLLFALAAQMAPSANANVLKPHTRMILKLISYALLALGFMGIVNGVGLLVLKNWARKAIAFCSGTAVIVSVMGLYTCIALLGFPNSPELTPRAAHVLWGSFFGISLFVLGISLWWVILFTRDSTVAAFASSSAEQGEITPRAPRCPLALALFAGYYIVVAVITVTQLVLPKKVPDMVFGHALFGPPSNLYVVAIGSLCLLAAIGLFKLQPWGIALAMAIEIFSLAKRLVTIFDPRSAQIMRNALAAMAAHGYKAPAGDPTFHLRYFESLAFGFSLALLVLLLLSRSRFLQAASEIASSSSSQHLP